MQMILKKQATLQELSRFALDEMYKQPAKKESNKIYKLCGRLPQYSPAPCKLTFDLLTLKVVSESRVMWATSVPILVFLGLCSRLKPDVHDRQTSDAHHRLTPPTLGTGA